MTMLENNRTSSLSALERIEAQFPPVVITAETVASMTVEAIEEELRQLGFAPEQPLPAATRHIIERKGRSLRKIGYYKYLGRKLYKRLPSVTSIPKRIGDCGFVQRITAAIMLLPIRHQVNLHIVSATLILAVTLFYANLNSGSEVIRSMGESAVKPSSDVGKGSEQKSVHKQQPEAGDKPVKDMFLSSEDI